MERGDIYLVSLDPSAGHEQQGKRPVLVVSPGRFNRLTGVPIVLPITTGGSFARTAAPALPALPYRSWVLARRRSALCAAISHALWICAHEGPKSLKRFLIT